MRLTPCCYSLVDSLWVWSTLVFLPDSRSTALKRTPIFRPVCFVCVRLYLFSLLFICGFTNSRSWQQQFDSSISKIQWFLFWWGRENLLRLCVFTLLCHHLGAHSFPSSAILTNHFWFIQALSFPFFFLPHVSQQQHSMFNISLFLSLSHSVGSCVQVTFIDRLWASSCSRLVDDDLLLLIKPWRRPRRVRGVIFSPSFYSTLFHGIRRRRRKRWEGVSK